MAAGFLTRLAGTEVEVLSAGTEPAGEVSPVVVAAMAEKGVDISRERPRLLADSTVMQADVVVTMGCGDACPFFPGKRYQDWELEDPAGRPIEAVRPIRDEIEQRVRAPVAELVGVA
jgi:protein-tyrosine-phosphatase